MKKYLMTGVAALAFAATFTSCSKAGDLYDENKVNEQKEATVKESYATAFEQAFGKPAKGHHWGFGSTTRAFETSASTRSHNVNGNLWYQDWERPTNVTEAEKAKVIEEFSKVRTNAVNTVNITWENFWVQQVYKGTAEYVDGNSSSIGAGSNQMNKLIVYNSNYIEEVYWPERKTINGGYEHINNFNNGNNTTEYTDDVTHQKYIGTTLMVDMATDGRAEQFGYHNSTDSKDHFEYIILEIDGSYYVGFDFYAHGTDVYPSNHNMDVERDWIFNDWIVKISPAYPKSVENGRVFCEDLGTIGDFDFNDVVFDARIYADGNIDIQVLAAGGKLPISVAGTPIAIGQMTNTGVNAGGTQNIHIAPENGQPKYATIKDIPIVVSGNNEAKYALGAPEGEAPQKICVPIGTRWVDEYVNIKNAYPKFTDWVQDESVKFWEQPVAKYVDLILSNNN